MNTKGLEDRLLSAGVRHLREFGYPDCNPTNIFTDYIYSQFFKRQLEGTIEDAPMESVKVACRNLIERIKPVPLKDESKNTKRKAKK